MDRRREADVDLIMPWHIVVCINDKFSEEVLSTTYAVPKKGEVYTVRNAVNHGPGITGLILFELINPPVFMQQPNGVTIVCETTFNVNRFRIVGHYSSIVELFEEDEDFKSYFAL